MTDNDPISETSRDSTATPFRIMEKVNEPEGSANNITGSVQNIDGVASSCYQNRTEGEKVRKIY